MRKSQTPRKQQQQSLTCFDDARARFGQLILFHFPCLLSFLLLFYGFFNDLFPAFLFISSSVSIIFFILLVSTCKLVPSIFEET
jgi:hypothetical protein